MPYCLGKYVSFSSIFEPYFLLLGNFIKIFLTKISEYILFDGFFVKLKF